MSVKKLCGGGLDGSAYNSRWINISSETVPGGFGFSAVVTNPTRDSVSCFLRGVKGTSL
jgi:hypothetical protein